MNTLANGTRSGGRVAPACLAFFVTACGRSESDRLATTGDSPEVDATEDQVTAEQPDMGNSSPATDAGSGDATGDDSKDSGAPSIDPGQAASACTLQKDCADGLFCDRKRYMCVQCREAGDCEPGTPCEHGRCGMAQSCNDSQGCSSRAVCVTGKCVPLVCEPDALVCAGRSVATCNTDGNGFALGSTYCGQYPCELVDGVAQCSAPPIPEPQDALNTNGDLSMGGDGWSMSTADGQAPYEPDAGRICTSQAELTVSWSDSPVTLPGDRYRLSYRTFTTRVVAVGDGGGVAATVAGNSLPLVGISQNGIRDVSVEFETDGDHSFQISIDVYASGPAVVCVDDIWVVPAK